MGVFGYCIFVVLSLIVNESVLCHGGVTSSFVRKIEKTIDMPLDSDVFRVPPGYNAPQQVSSYSHSQGDRSECMGVGSYNTRRSRGKGGNCFMGDYG
ncbi:hypothetical protein KY289_034281 [Solanum tuberosum]|nr:hypothetical protein KY289_034281 [Solanum tuberosum]KAH0727584.1 hypothetical protein KY284_003449 [Solanum tuberosum]